MPRSRLGTISIRGPKERFHSWRHLEPPTKNAWPVLLVRPARPLAKPLPAQEVRWTGIPVVGPRIQERFPKLFPAIPAQLWLDPWPAADSPNRAMPAHFANRAAAPGETLLRLLPIFRHADRLGPAMYASRTAAAQWQAPSYTPARHLPNGHAEIRDRRENDVPKPPRDTDGLLDRPTEPQDLSTHVRV